MSAHDDQLARARRASEAASLRDASQRDLAIWVFCVWCGHAHITEPHYLAGLVKEPPNMLDELERRLTCHTCNRKGVKLIPTDRTTVSFERMGGARDYGR